MDISRNSACLGALSLLAPFCVHAQSGNAPWTPMPNPDPRLATLRTAQSTRLRAPSSAAISPDGTLLAWSISNREGAQLHLTDLSNPDPAKDKIITPNSDTNCSNAQPVFSPDSQTLAYTSTCTATEEKPGQPQIFLYSRATGVSKQLTHLTGIFQQATFSPDGKSLAFLFVENATRSAGALAPMKPWSGVIGEDGVEVQRVYAVSVSVGSGGFVTPANLHVYEFAYSPTTPEMTYIAAPLPGENTWWIAKLFTHPESCAGICPDKIVFDPNTTPTALHGLQIAVPRFSPDGKQIAFIGGLMSDQGSTGGDIWVIPSSGSQTPTDVTPNIDGTPTWLAWTGPNNIGFVEDRSGHTLLTDYLVPSKSQDAQVDLGETSVAGGPIKNAIGVSTHGTLAFIKSGHATPPELWAGPFDSLRQITHLNDGATPPARTESVEWTNSVTPGSPQIFHVQGWLTYPKDYDPAKKYPLIVSVHGGPSASAGASWAGSPWASLGYFVFAPNPRGSFGQGEQFTAANKQDFGYGDLRDITSGMDSIEARLPIDKNREGLTGGSYGGFMTMFAVTQTTRFRAAIAIAGISDWKSYYGENSIDQWMVPFFGATVYADPAVYAKSSAIEFIQHAKTPMLIVVGDRDGECPPPQSFEMWHALRAENVPTQLVIYPNEGHGIRQPDHARDLEARELAWWEKYMPAK